MTTIRVFGELRIQRDDGRVTVIRFSEYGERVWGTKVGAFARSLARQIRKAAA